MKTQVYIVPLFAVVITVWYGCKKAYVPKVVSANNNYLVVEASINTGADSTIITLSRSVPVSSKASATPETGAAVSIVSDANAAYPVIEKGNGIYMGVPINANAQAKYALKITTKSGESYQSDFVAAVNSPPIDSVYYVIQSNGLNILLDTHDATNTAKYYRWDYNETYVFHTEFDSHGIVSGTPPDTILYRPPADEIYQCWHTDTSSNTLLGSSAKLSQDVLVKNPIIFIPSTSVKIESRYSIQVTQYALSSDAFNYYTQLKQNTENIGTIFDPQPSELPGNIHSLSNPSEPVIGYVTAGATSTTRIFIDIHNLPEWQTDDPYASCLLDTATYKLMPQRNLISDVFYNYYERPVDPVSDIVNGKINIWGWSGSSPLCVDCTLNGSNVRPLFWTDYTP